MQILLKSQKNELFNAIERFGFSPGMFFLDESNSDFTMVRYKDSDYYFSVRLGNGNGLYYYRYTPSETKLLQDSMAANWPLLASQYAMWLTSLRKEIDAVDKWQEFRAELPDFTLTTTGSEGKFSYEEVTQIETKIYLLKSKILEIPLSTNQAEALNQKLDYCIELAKTANKFDWGSYFLGVITNIILTLSVTPENAHLIWDAVKMAFNNFILK